MKKGNNLVKKFYPILRYETEAITEYLEKMAAEGLFIKSIDRVIYTFEKTEPRKVKFYIDAFDKASWFDTRAEEETLDYKEYCERAGWNYVCTDGKFQVFYTENMDAVPIETDMNKRLNMIIKASISTAIISPLWTILLMLIVLATPTMILFTRPNEIIELSYPTCGAFIMWLFLGIDAIIKLLDTVRFWLRNKISISRQGCFKMRSLRQADRKMIIDYTILILMFFVAVTLCFLINVVFGAIFGVIGSLIWIASIVIGKFVGGNREKRSRNFNKTTTVIMTFVGIGIGIIVSMAVIVAVLFTVILDDGAEKIVYFDNEGNEEIAYVQHDDIPYTLEDAGYKISENGYCDTRAEVSHNILCTQYEYTDMYYENGNDYPRYEIEYSKTVFKNAKWCKFWLKNCLKANDYQMIALDEEIKKWDANHVYARKYDYGYEELVVVYDDYIYILTMNMNKPDEVRKIL